jgi:hypothetical protein
LKVETLWAYCETFEDRFCVVGNSVFLCLLDLGIYSFSDPRGLQCTVFGIMLHKSFSNRCACLFDRLRGRNKQGPNQGEFCVHSFRISALIKWFEMATGLDGVYKLAMITMFHHKSKREIIYSPVKINKHDFLYPFTFEF